MSVGITADLEVRVPRGADGDLRTGVKSRLTQVTGVTDFDNVELVTVQPRLNDLVVEVTADLTVAVDANPDADEAARTILNDGFGVTVKTISRAER